MHVQVCETSVNQTGNELDEDKQLAIDKIVEGEDKVVPLPDRSRLAEILQKFKTVFAFGENEIGRTSATRHEIDTENARPIRRQRLRHQVENKKAVIISSALLKTLNKYGLTSEYLKANLIAFACDGASVML